MVLTKLSTAGRLQANSPISQIPAHLNCLNKNYAPGSAQTNRPVGNKASPAGYWRLTFPIHPGSAQKTTARSKVQSIHDCRLPIHAFPRAPSLIKKVISTLYRAYMKFLIYPYDDNQTVK
ncbi:hypothetical protein A4R26_03705 [Niastella populi]|uniref:Uncharacterized protein n=1 Tax=Niastella populi TaxID=550983 RepID=A0A1V9FJR5_9BACT|nr:hypothetical protein A4R26_03705 [Niastella populi]